MTDVTNQQDGGPAGNTPPEVTVEEAQRLYAGADRLEAESIRLGNESDVTRAKAECILAVIDRRERLAGLSAEFEQARGALARATAEADPVAADLERVEQELATADPSAGTLDEQLAAHGRIYALTQVVEPLRARLASLQRAVEDARELVRSYEQDQVPDATRELERAVSALLHPPFDDMAQLMEFAPQAAHRYINRVGPYVTDASRARTPHAWHVYAALVPALGASGLLGMHVDVLLSQLGKKVDGQTHAKVKAALKPEPPQVFEQYNPAIARDVDPNALKRAAALAQLGGPPQGGLPGYDTEQGYAMRVGNQAPRYRGPIDWPPFNT